MTDENVIDFEQRRARKLSAASEPPRSEVAPAATEPMTDAEIVGMVTEILASLDGSAEQDDERPR